MCARRLPLQSVHGQVLQDLFYLGELARQADIFDRSFSDAMASAAQEDVLGVWRHLQAALFSGIIVNRLLRSEGARNRKLADPRAARLRSLIGLADTDDTPLLTLHEIRNDLEHIDERLDERLSDQSTVSLADFYLSDGFYLMSGSGSGGNHVFAGLRAFNPNLGLLHFDHRSINMFALDLDMLRLKHNAREAQHKERLKVHGRQPFSAFAWKLDAAASGVDYRALWDDQRKDLVVNMCSEPDLAPNIRLFLQPEDHPR